MTWKLKLPGNLRDNPRKLGLLNHSVNGGGHTFTVTYSNISDECEAILFVLREFLNLEFLFFTKYPPLFM